MSTTINGVVFNMNSLHPVVTHRNIINEELGTDTTFITNTGYSGIVIKITGFETTLEKYDDVIAEFMKPGDQILGYRSGWQLSVHSTQLIPLLSHGIVDNWFPYELLMVTNTPYRESSSELTKTKTITTNNQEWSADNSSNDIDTDGNVDTKPDIKIIGGAVGSSYDRVRFGFADTDTTIYSSAGGAWSLKKTYIFSGGLSIKYILDTIGLDLAEDNHSSIVYGKATYQAVSLNSGVETDVPGGSWSTGSNDFTPFSVSNLNIECAGNELLTVRFYMRCGSTSTMRMRNLDINVLYYKKNICTDPKIYNISDPSVKLEGCNELDPDAIIYINTDGSGTFEYGDDLSTTKYVDACWAEQNTTYDAVDDELDIADDGYLDYRIDLTHPITGIPVLTSQLNITTGTPTIQISTDGVTWYDIDTAIVDDVDTEYELDSSSLSLKGLTIFYLRFDCGKAAAATMSIKSFELNLTISYIDIETPLISSSGVSTFRCDQDSISGLNCEISLIYRHRSWVG